MAPQLNHILLTFALLRAGITSGQEVFAVTGEANYAENLEYGFCSAPLTEDSSPYFCSNSNEKNHESFLQKFYVNNVLQFTIDWAFSTGPKTLKQRFLDAQNIGEQVVWSVVAESGFAETHSGVWWFSDNAKLEETFSGATSSNLPFFSFDDGSWGAAFHDGVQPVNGNNRGSVQTGWGHENYHSSDIATCKLWYANGIRNECGQGDTIRNVMIVLSTTNTPGGPGNSGGPQGTCFHGDTLLTLEDNTVKAMSELHVGDTIQTADINGNLVFAPIISLPHAPKNNETANFLTLMTDSGKTLRLTPGHLIPTCAAGMELPASELLIGDCLMTVDGKETLVEITSPAKDYGIYTAITRDMFIVVNGIVASSFSIENVKEHPEHKREFYDTDPESDEGLL